MATKHEGGKSKRASRIEAFRPFLCLADQRRLYTLGHKRNGAQPCAGCVMNRVGKRRANAGFSRKVSVIRDSGNCVVADAVAVEPVSASKFPDMRESAGNFCNLQGIWP